MNTEPEGENQTGVEDDHRPIGRIMSHGPRYGLCVFAEQGSAAGCYDIGPHPGKIVELKNGLYNDKGGNKEQEFVFCFYQRIIVALVIGMIQNYPDAAQKYRYDFQKKR